ncbi:helix-turn-helix transcriptional regulator [Actinosynnema sp. NPDC023794]
MARASRVTPTMVAVLHVFFDDPAVARYGVDLYRTPGVRMGALYPVLARLEAEGWVISEWDGEVDTNRQAAPRRRRYRISPSGMRVAARHVATRRATQPSSSLGWA